MSSNLFHLASEGDSVMYPLVAFSIATVACGLEQTLFGSSSCRQRLESPFGEGRKDENNGLVRFCKWLQRS
ncbi:MAG: hypothetical protein HC780_09670 [Leptolyngbyaceae cyanobacterium CSU_1_3]|nr:hypothetical protein [Leptolyngbyaceae cyanobacterium CSU_1_3]